MSIFDALPLLEGWEKKLTNIGKFIVSAGSSAEIFSKTYYGWCHSMTFVLNNPFSGIEFQEREYSQTLSPFFLQSSGINAPNTSGWVSVYNPNLGLYIMTYIFSPHVSAREYNRLVLHAANENEITLGTITTPTTLTSGRVTTIEIGDEDAFLKSYWKLKWGRLAPILETVNRVPLLKTIGKMIGQPNLKELRED